MNNEIIGHIECQLCGADNDVKASKKGKGYYCCGSCGTQLFARNNQADTLLRKKMKPIVAVPSVEKITEDKNNQDFEYLPKKEKKEPEKENKAGGWF